MSVTIFVSSLVWDSESTGSVGLDVCGLGEGDDGFEGWSDGVPSGLVLFLGSLEPAGSLLVSGLLGSSIARVPIFDPGN